MRIIVMFLSFNVSFLRLSAFDVCVEIDFFILFLSHKFVVFASRLIATWSYDLPLRLILMHLSTYYRRLYFAFVLLARREYYVGFRDYIVLHRTAIVLHFSPTEHAKSDNCFV